MRYPKIRELKEAIRALMSRPYTSKFPAEPHTPHRNFRGQPKFNAERCVGCLACEMVCPVDAIAHADHPDADPPTRTMIHYTDTCIFCGQCEAACIADHEGIKASNDWELSFFDRPTESCETIDKALLLCEVCGEPFACRDHLEWIAQRLGELTYSSPTLYLQRLRRLGIADPNLVATLREGARSDRMKILCARCRRQTTLTTHAD